MRRFDVRSNGTLTTDSAGPGVVRLQQSLLRQHHRQRNAAESRAGVVEKSAAVQQMMAGECVGCFHRSCHSRRSFLPAVLATFLIIILLLIIIDFPELFMNKNLNPRLSPKSSRLAPPRRAHKGQMSSTNLRAISRNSAEATFDCFTAFIRPGSSRGAMMATLAEQGVTRVVADMASHDRPGEA